MQVQTALLFESPEEIYLRVFRLLRPRTALPGILVEFRPYANPNSYISIHDGRLHVKIADVLRGAPAPIQEALAFILLSKLFRKPVPPIYADRYRRYLNRKDVARTLYLIREQRGRKYVSEPQGEHYDLEEIFEDLNRRYFHGLMARPRLGCSRYRARTSLGHYDPSHNAIIISRIFDSPAVPRLALEYVVFHEMLHLRFPIERQHGLRRFHTREFREAEREFENLKQAKELLKRL
jgi:hypothetical protein